jgi:hypothetical protein
VPERRGLMQMTACGETFGGSVYQAPDVFMFAIHQTLIPKDAFMLTPKLGTNWGRRVLQFSANGVVFVTINRSISRVRFFLT